MCIKTPSLVVALYHSHLGEVDQVVLGVVGCSFLNEGQVSQVHTQVGYAGRVTAENSPQVRKRQQLCRYTDTNRMCEHLMVN